jgi:DNA-binding transcriptional regulator YhcF (GntR family)
MKILSPSRRRRVPYGLPDLGALECTRVPYLDKAGAIATRLRQIAAKTRNDDLQPFYSMRAVADHFHVPLARVSRIYQRLSAERLLRTVWGSRTLLEPNRSSRNSESRSIGIAIDLGRFLKSSDYRVSILSLQFEIWNHEIIDQLLFFEEEPGELVRLCTRNHHPHISTIVWLLPERSHNQTLLRLHDLGLRVICLSDHVVPGIADCYTVSPRCTIRTIIRKKILKI